MRLTLALRQHRQPLIRFLGKRRIPQNVDHTPHAHPAAPDHSLPESFASYRGRAIQHGPLGGGQPQQSQSNSGSGSGSVPSSSSTRSASAPTPGSAGGGIGARSAKQLGPIKIGEGEVGDRNELPKRFRRTGWSAEEMDAVASGGASLFG